MNDSIQRVVNLLLLFTLVLFPRRRWRIGVRWDIQLIAASGSNFYLATPGLRSIVSQDPPRSRRDRSLYGVDLAFNAQDLSLHAVGLTLEDHGQSFYEVNLALDAINRFMVANLLSTLSIVSRGRPCPLRLAIYPFTGSNLLTHHPPPHTFPPPLPPVNGNPTSRPSSVQL